MLGVMVLAVTFEFSLLITGLGVGLIELEMTIGVGITGLVVGLIVTLGGWRRDLRGRPHL